MNVTCPLLFLTLHCLLTTYDKLVMYGFWAHGYIDDVSHYVLCVKLASNKFQETIFEPFRLVVTKFGALLGVDKVK
jgi:hypothetical protein